MKFKTCLFFPSTLLICEMCFPFRAPAAEVSEEEVDSEVVVEGASQVAEVLEDRDVENVEKRDTSLENALTNLLEVTCFSFQAIQHNLFY